MTPEPQLWIDVTTILHWRRPAVGIVRVEQQLCLAALAAAAPQIAFCSYSRALRQFESVDPEHLRAHLAWLDRLGAAPAGPPPAPDFEQRLRVRVKTALDRLPPAIGQPLIRLLMHLHQRHFATAQRLWRPVRRRGLDLLARFRRFIRPSATVAAAPPPASLRLPAGSVYVSLGLDWDYKDMADLYHKKQQMGFRCLFMCYDIIPVLRPQLCVADVSRQFAHYFADLAWAADRILCISQSSQRDLLALLERLAVPAPSTAVIHLGADPVADTAALPWPTALPAAPYVLFVSTIERRKNHEILYRAWHRLASEPGLELPQLVFVGMPGWGVNELLADLSLDPLVAGRITILNHVGDAELAALYRHALFTVYPSLYEGWGLPVAESLAFGQYCLCANTSSLPEVGGELVDYLDPWDLPAWVDKLRFLITHPDWLAERKARIAASYVPHPWRATADEIVEHARELAAAGCPTVGEPAP